MSMQCVSRELQLKWSRFYEAQCAINRVTHEWLVTTEEKQHLQQVSNDMRALSDCYHRLRTTYPTLFDVNFVNSLTPHYGYVAYLPPHLLLRPWQMDEARKTGIDDSLVVQTINKVEADTHKDVPDNAAEPSTGITTSARAASQEEGPRPPKYSGTRLPKQAGGDAPVDAGGGKHTIKKYLAEAPKPPSPAMIRFRTATDDTKEIEITAEDLEHPM
eukprot:903744-Pyramimonas_sp.AAC.1